MTDFTAVFVDVWSTAWDLPIVRFVFSLLPLAICISCFRSILFGLIGPPYCLSFSFFKDLWVWLADKIVTLMCRSEKGFNLAYKLGWARPGVDFFECGIDCLTCPKKDTCPSRPPDAAVKLALNKRSQGIEL